MLSSLIDLFSILKRKNKIKLIYLQLLLITSGLLEVASIFIIAPFMSLVSGNLDPDKSTFILYLKNFLNISEVNDLIFATGLITLLVFTLSAFITILTIYIVTYFGNKIGAEISTSLYNLYLSKPFLFHLNTNSSDLVSKISFDAERTTSIFLRVLTTNLGIIKSISIVIALLIYNYKVALVLGTTFISTYVFIFFILQSKFTKIGYILSDQKSKIYKLLSEGFGSIKDIIILSRKNFFVSEFENSQNIVARKSAFVTTMSLTPKQVIETVALGSVISLILYFARTSEENITAILTTLAVFGLGSYKLLPSFQDIYFNLSSIKSSIPAYKAIQSYLHEAKKLEEIKYIDEKISFKKNDTLEFEKVSFSYTDSDIPSLKNINTKINANTSVGIVGQTGAGKSTFGNLILGLFSPTSGSLKINKYIIDSKDKINSWQKNISFVPQNLFLLESSIKKNIAFTFDDKLIDEEKLQKSCEQAQLLDFITTLKDGYETQIGEKGMKLSGGQQQRIGIARAIYNDTNILFFDEATSALDGVTEEKVISSLKKNNNKTIFLISHNFATIKNCDKILYFEKGEIAKEGTYKELMENENFRKLSEVS
jgi:ATP-binding cassette, subfamily B, bacterial PglK